MTNDHVEISAIYRMFTRVTCSLLSVIVTMSNEEERRWKRKHKRLVTKVTLQFYMHEPRKGCKTTKVNFHIHFSICFVCVRFTFIVDLRVERNVTSCNLTWLGNVENDLKATKRWWRRKASRFCEKGAIYWSLSSFWRGSFSTVSFVLILPFPLFFCHCTMHTRIGSTHIVTEQRQLFDSSFICFICCHKLKCEIWDTMITMTKDDL